jgi:hypothetical protein
MGNLDPKHGAAHAPGLRDHAGQGGFIIVGVHPKTAMGDTAMPFDMSCLHNHQGGTGMSQHPEVHEMPIIGAAVVSGILAHRRNHDAIGKLQARQAKRREQGTRHEVDSTLARKI